MSWGDPKRVRVAVRFGGEHIGYLTVTSYPDRDILAFTEGTPHSEVVVSDLADRHVALLQRFRAHWLVHCGTTYCTTEHGGELSDKRIMRLAEFALRYRDKPAPRLAEQIQKHVDRMLAEQEKM